MENMGSVRQTIGGRPHPPLLRGNLDLKDLMQWRYPQRPGSAGSTQLVSDFKTLEEVGVAKKLDSRNTLLAIPGRTIATSLGAVLLGEYVGVYLGKWVTVQCYV